MSLDAPDRMPHPDTQEFLPGSSPFSYGSSESPISSKTDQADEASQPYTTPDRTVLYGSKISVDAKDEAVLKSPMGLRCIITWADSFIGTLQMAHVLRRSTSERTVRTPTCSISIATYSFFTAQKFGTSLGQGHQCRYTMECHRT